MNKLNSTSSVISPTTNQPVFDLPDLSQQTAYELASALNHTFIFMGYDAEWVENNGVRRILSYQTYVIVDGATQGGFIFFPNAVSEAWSLSRLISETAKSFTMRFPSFEWPADTAVLLVCHNALADISALDGYEETKKEFDSLRKTMTTLKESYRPKVRVSNGLMKSLRVFLRDTMLVSPQGQQSLSAIGKMINCPKIELPEGAIEDMEQLLQTDPDLFEEYGIRDAEIALKYYLAFTGMFEGLLGYSGNPMFPPTLGYCSALFAEGIWKETGVDTLEVVGKEEVVETKWCHRRNRTIKPTKLVYRSTISDFQDQATEAYHGGRNEAYYFGPSQEEAITDYDIRSAYTTAMASLGMPQWDELRATSDLNDFHYGTLGAAKISFEFPDTVQYPVIPVRTNTGCLIFPLKGRDAYVTSTEMRLAVELGATLKVQYGWIVPTKSDSYPFFSLVREGLQMREQFKAAKGKGCPEERLVKELMNSLYGKGSQGLRTKRIYDSRVDKHRALPQHRLTNPMIAGYVTGLIRAALGEMMNKLPRERRIYTVTTDGFLTNSTDLEVEDASQGSVCLLLAETRARLTGKKEGVLEVKHRAKQVLNWRRRSAVTLKGHPGFEPILAKAGIKPPGKASNQEQNDWLKKSFLNRTYGQKYPMKRLPGVYELYHGEVADYIEITQDVRLGMDYDFSCCPALETATEIPVDNVYHLCFHTKSWDDVDAYHKARDDFDAWAKSSSRVLKSQQDLRDFMDYFVTPKTGKANRSTKGSPMKIAVRMFLRACKQGGLGMSRYRCSRGGVNDLLQDWLIYTLVNMLGKHLTCSEARNILPWTNEKVFFEGGKSFRYVGTKPLGMNLIENSGRKGSSVVENAVPRTPGTEAFFRAAKRLCPDLSEELYFA